jgi:aminopeptidase S
VSDARALEHIKALQKIADEHGGSRAAGTPSYDASVEYACCATCGMAVLQGFDATDGAVIEVMGAGIAGGSARMQSRRPAR